MRRVIIGTLVIGCLVAVGIPSLSLLYVPLDARHDVQPAPAQRRQPDIVLVTIDALRADHLSGYGYGRLTSPAIDAFSEHAVLFTQAVAQAPYTKASIASLMSGLYPTAHKAVTTTAPFPETMTGHLTTAPITTDVLSSGITTLAEGLRAAGYRTLGFTANPFLIAPFGFAQGFDVFEFFPGQDFAAAARIVDTALTAVQRSGPMPVFLWLHLMEPHSPYAPPALTSGLFRPVGRPQPIPSTVSIPAWLIEGSPRDLRLYESRYDEEVAAADVAIDVLVRELGDLRDRENTVVVLTADHGEQFLDHGGWEHSDTLYDELIRVPLIIRVPQVRPRIVSSQVQLIDLYPTLLELGRAEAQPGQVGQTLIPVLHGAERSQPAFSEIAGGQYAIRMDGWKLIVWADGRQALFDLRHDSHEQHDVATAEPARVASLRRVLDRYLAAAIVRGRTIEGAGAAVDPRVLQRLRTLGYVGS
jgi:arylsulfatase A-like enzyme